MDTSENINPSNVIREANTKYDLELRAAIMESNSSLEGPLSADSSMLSFTLELEMAMVSGCALFWGSFSMICSRPPRGSVVYSWGG